MMSPIVVFFLLTVLGQTRGVTANIAKYGKVAQSSVDYGGIPELAVDGKRNSVWLKGSCTHTNKEDNPWWRLDLQKKHTIKTVTITNRKDCCWHRISGAEIHIGDSLRNNGNANPRCAVIQSIEAGGTVAYDCNGMEGRYVNIVIPGKQKILTLCEVEVSGQPSVNIAKDGKVAQSSVAHGGIPARAVDGKSASDWSKGSCTHTNKEDNPWWRLDLQKQHTIKTVTITNRKDCCWHRISGAEIRIGHSLQNNGNANPRCAVIQSIEAGDSVAYDCNGMEGRYVNIVIPGKQKILTLCEVEVSGQPSANIAKDGKVAQSSVDYGGIPELAVDGKRNSVWLKGSCTHTNKEDNPWWRLDLQKKHTIRTVTITNRKDCCWHRISGAEIRIGDSLRNNGNANPRCAVIQSIEAGGTVAYDCNGMEGRYVNIVIPGKQKILTLCEVEVSGQPSANIAKGGKVAQSSVAHGGVPGRAVDGKRASVWPKGSCTHTNKEDNPWWRLDLQKKHTIRTVTITNREDCCWDRINGAEIRIGDSLRNNGNANPRCIVIKSIKAGDSVVYDCNGMAGRYVNIVIPGKQKILTLCEVEVNPV